MRIVPAEYEGLPSLLAYALLSQKGKYFEPLTWGNTYRSDQGNMSTTNGYVYAKAFYLPRALKIDRISMYIGFVNSTSYNWFAVYRAERLGHRYPEGLIHDFGEFTVTATGESYGNANCPTVLGPGLMWIAVFYKTGTGYSYPKVGVGRPRMNVYGFNVATSYADSQYGIVGAATYPSGSAPSTFPASVAWTRNNLPALYFRMAA